MRRPGRMGGGIRSAAAAFHVVLSAVAVVLIFTQYDSLGSAGLTWVCRVVTAGALINLAVTVFVAGGPWAPSSAYISVFTLFHFGLVAVLGVGLRSENNLGWWNQAWIFSVAARQAAALALAGVLACTSGSFVVRLVAGAVSTRRQAPLRQADDTLAKIGAVLLVVCTVSWFAIVTAAGGFLLLVSSYGTYLEKTAPYGALLALVWMGNGLGFVLVTMARSSRWRVLGLVTYLVLSAVAVPLGLRGEILFPAVAAGVARARVGRPLSTRFTLVASILVLLVIGAVRQLRQAGLAHTGVDVVESASVTNALVELGGSLQPVQAVVTWRNRGDAYALGGTYWAPFDRALVYVIPGWRRVPAEEDERIMNILVVRRIGPIGFSPVAEAYRNFGPSGVVLVMFVVGLTIGMLDRLKGTPEWQFAGTVVLVPLLTNIRNSFVSLPPQIVLGGILVVLFLFLRPRRVAGRGRALAPQVRAGASLHA